ncbi:MAG: PAS domain S-box protein, partial [Deltaproteobacteria bacterium]|nr:PAS domain S-box protein [Deltaproteobacteria bacterium]
MSEMSESERAELHDGLVSLLREISDRPTLADVLQTAILRMSQLFHIDRVSVVLFQPQSDVAFVVAEHEEALIDSVVLRLADYPEPGRIIESREPLIIPDLADHTLFHGVRKKLAQANKPPRAAALFPLLHNRKVVGALFLRSQVPMGTVDSKLVSMGRLVASVTSVAIGAALAHDTLLSEQRALRRKKAEVDEKLAGLQQFSEFFAQSKDGIVVCDEAGAVRYANPAAAHIVRRASDVLKGQSFADLLAERSRRLAERAIRGDAVGDGYGYIDLIVPVEGDDEVVISAAIRALSDPEGVLVTFRDVTELREIETELRHTKDFLENLIQSSVDAIVAADVEGRIMLFNRAAEAFLGYDAHEVVGRMRVQDLYPPGDAHDVMRRLRSDAFGGRGRLEATRKTLIAKSGEEVPVLLTAAIIYEGAEEAASVGVFTDLRERVKMEEKLSQVQKQLQVTERQAVAAELAGAAAHELNQPLTSILGYAEMLKR